MTILDFQLNKLSYFLSTRPIPPNPPPQPPPPPPPTNFMLPRNFQVNWPFCSGEEAKNRFSRWPPQPPSWISDQNNFSHFLSTSNPDASYPVSSQLAFRFRRRREKQIFKMAATVAILVSDQNNFSYF